MYICLRVKYPFFLSHFNVTSTSATDFRKIQKYQISWTERRNHFWISETRTGQQVSQLHNRYMIMMMMMVMMMMMMMMKIRSLGTELSHGEGETDRDDEGNSRYLQFGNAAKYVWASLNFKGTPMMFNSADLWYETRRRMYVSSRSCNRLPVSREGNEGGVGLVPWSGGTGFLEKVLLKKLLKLARIEVHLCDGQDSDARWHPPPTQKRSPNCRWIQQLTGHATSEVDIRRTLTAEVRVQSRPVQVRFIDDEVTTGINLPPSTSCFPCQYYSTNAPYSLTHSSPVLLNLTE